MTCKCPHCGKEINPASLLGQKKKTMTPEAVAARKANASKPRVRLTRAATESIKAAGAAQIHPFQGGPACMLSVSCGGNSVYVTGPDQDAVLFDSPVAARLVLRRLRPDIEPTLA